ncbi:MAG: hypothetical protein ACI8W8_003313 [Rhodothermales bacterium]|jgi:uncharacterized protein (DUF58 family)
MADGLAIDPNLLNRLKGMELKSRFLVRGLYSNRHRTADFGHSTEFIQHREYRRGDEIRQIDWRVYARTGRFYVKQHEMESDMRVTFLLDTSDSMRVAPDEGLPSKLELAATIAGAIAIMAQVQQDSVGLVCLADEIAEFVPARQGEQHLALLYDHLSNPPGGGGGHFGRLVNDAGARLGNRGMVFILSDCWDSPEELYDAMKILRVREQDVSLIQVVDKNEMAFPFDRMTEFRHPESGDRIIGDPTVLRAKYLERMHAHLATLESYCKKLQVDYLRLSNADDLIDLLSVHFIKRGLEAG